MARRPGYTTSWANSTDSNPLTASEKYDSADYKHIGEPAGCW
jgi:hypothetical protein